MKGVIRRTFGGAPEEFRRSSLHEGRDSEEFWRSSGGAPEEFLSRSCHEGSDSEDFRRSSRRVPDELRREGSGSEDFRRSSGGVPEEVVPMEALPGGLLFPWRCYSEELWRSSGGCSHGEPAQLFGGPIYLKDFRRSFGRGWSHRGAIRRTCGGVLEEFRRRLRHEGGDSEEFWVPEEVVLRRE